jgi:hypothetical protein
MIPADGTLAPGIKLRETIDRLVNLLQAVWEVVRDVLCNDAPEGHVPNELEHDSSLTYKDILSYSWRALKEARYERQTSFKTCTNSS